MLLHSITMVIIILIVFLLTLSDQIVWFLS